jgi:clan AA aspartic protease (TIGR02281 family)
MKLLLGIAVFLLALSITGLSWADTVYLKNGRLMKGVITKEKEEYVELDIGIGAVKFYRNQIDRVVYSSESDKKALEQSWESESLKKKVELAQQDKRTDDFRKEIKTNRLGDHLLVNVLLNGNTKANLLVDTGASNVILSLQKAQELGLGIKKEDKADAKMKLADGTEAEVKLCDLKSVNVDGVEVENVHAAVLLNEGFFKEFDGLLGMTYLKSFKFQINLEQNLLILQNLQDDEKGTGSSR